MKLTVAANKSRSVSVYGRVFRLRTASHPFDLRVKGPQLDYRIGLDDREAFGLLPGQFFHALEFDNTANAKALHVDYDAAPIELLGTSLRVPMSEMVGWPVTLADGATQNFPGYATSDADYSTHSVPVGARRKHFIVSTRPALNGIIEVRNQTTTRLLAIIAAPGAGSSGFILETAANLQITNNTGAVLDNTGVNPDIAVAEAFYL